MVDALCGKYAGFKERTCDGLVRVVGMCGAGGEGKGPMNRWWVCKRGIAEVALGWSWDVIPMWSLSGFGVVLE